MNDRKDYRWPASMPDYDDICARWHEAVIANHLLKWRAIAAWLKSVSLMCEADAMDEAADSMRTLSEVAQRRALDLQPVRDEEPTAGKTPFSTIFAEIFSGMGIDIK